jgi:hypothetical protein
MTRVIDDVYVFVSQQPGSVPNGVTGHNRCGLLGEPPMSRRIVVHGNLGGEHSVEGPLNIKALEALAGRLGEIVHIGIEGLGGVAMIGVGAVLLLSVL